jgi:hypothetical protein
MVMWRLSFSMDWAAVFVFVSAAGAGDGEARLIMICGWDGGGGVEGRWVGAAGNSLMASLMGEWISGWERVVSVCCCASL